MIFNNVKKLLRRGKIQLAIGEYENIELQDKHKYPAGGDDMNHKKIENIRLFSVATVCGLILILSMLGCSAGPGEVTEEKTPPVVAETTPKEPETTIIPVEPTPTERKTSIVPVKPSSVLRALWVWDAGVITDGAGRERFFEFCNSKKIGMIYLEVGSAMGAGGAKVPVSDEALAMFVGDAHARGMEVHALDGDANWAYRQNHSIPLNRLQRALDFNLSVGADERLDGFQFDIEPYVLPEFKTDEWRDVLVEYLNLVSQMRDKVKESSPNFGLGFAIPFWWDVENTEVSEVDWQGVSKPVAYHLADVLNGLRGGYIAIMDYRDFTGGPDGSIRHASDEIEYVNKNAPDVTVFIGQETGDVKETPKITFWQEGEDALEAAISELMSAFNRYSCFGGIAIHHYDSYRQLSGEVAPPIPPVSEEVISREKKFVITSPKKNDSVAMSTIVSGIASGAKEGWTVEVSVFPYGDIWYLQGQVAVSDDGTWILPCHFGNRGTPKGYKFKIRAVLIDAQGNEVETAELDYVMRQ